MTETNKHIHSLGRYSEADLKRSQQESRDEYGVNVLNIFYDMESGMMFCLLEAPDRAVIDKHHTKLGVQCNWITQVKMTTDFDV